MAWIRQPVITLLVVLAATAALLPHTADTRPLHGALAHRNLLADAKADSKSTGGASVSVSDAQGNADVKTSSDSSNGGTAVAVKSANDDASHIVSTAADGNSSFTYSSSSPHSKKGDAWDSAPACRNSSTATFDDSMRLWGWENSAPCAFKEEKVAAASTGDAWDSAPPCKHADTSAKKDDSGRLWGWEDNRSCAFKAPGDGGDAVWEAAKPCSKPASADNVKSTDNRERKWGWENNATCAFKGVASRKMLSYTDVLNMPAGQMTVTTLSYGDDVECTYADAGTSSSVNCKKKAAQAVPSGTKILLPAATSITPAGSELAPQPATNSLLTPATNAANPANPAAELTDTTSNSIAAEEPLATNTAVPDEDYPLEQPAESDVTLPADNAVLPAEDASVEDYPAEEPADATATNALPADNTVVPAEDYPEEEPADATAVNTLPAADAVAPVVDVPVEEPAADVAGNTITNAVPAGNTAVPVVPTPVADPAVAANVPALGGDYNVALGTPGYTVGGVKGAKNTFGKPVTADIPSGTIATTTPQDPAASVGVSTPPAAPEEAITPSPVPDASPAAAVAEPSASPATSSVPTWETAPVCVGQPTKQTSVQDLNGRLWWVVTSGSIWASCAYRAADGTAVYYDGFQQVQFDSSPACEHTASITDSMADSSGRLWGWKEGQAGEGVNCRFLKADGTPVMREEVY